MVGTRDPSVWIIERYQILFITKTDAVSLYCTKIHRKTSPLSRTEVRYSYLGPGQRKIRHLFLQGRLFKDILAVLYQ